MSKYFIFIAILFCSCSKYKGDKDSLTYDSIKIIFDGYGKCDVDGHLKIEITDPEQVKKLNLLKNKYQTNWLPAYKPAEFSMWLVFTDSNTGEQLGISITKGGFNTATVEYGTGTIFDGKYKNQEFVDYLSSIIQLEKIREFKGALTQEVYDSWNK